MLAVYAYQTFGKSGLFSSPSANGKVNPLRWPAVPLNTDFASESARRSEVLQDGARRWNRYPIPKRVSAFGAGGQQPGCNQNFTGLDVMFAPEYPPFSVMPFVEAQGTFFFDNTLGASFGIGGRALSNVIPALLGMNVFYDYREGTQSSFHQVSLGFEVIGKRFEFYANGYAPVGSSSNTQKCTFDQYVGNYKATRRSIQSSFYAADATLNIMAIKAGNFMVYTSGGPYYLRGKPNSPQIWGGQVGIQPQFGDYLSLSFNVSHDPHFGTLFQGGIMLSLPLYRFTSLGKPRTVTNRQIYQPAHRMMSTIPLDTHCCWKSNF